ncbi:uncharacterized protein PAC_14195 [Phialocephala subalpina]|uniref:non-specific serine/threonine protein kinase n=1 Tax=Phialocephala subalpina TaxID=576137 RepID=A0A1L7XH82_9HELO|nr:uncharacterized protein PAC_14195 [Phialocephala subalpina]
MSSILEWERSVILSNTFWAAFGTIACVVIGLCFFTFRQRSPLPPLIFPTTGFEISGESDMLDEEMNEEFLAGRYYPMNIDEVLVSKYQVIGKLVLQTWVWGHIHSMAHLRSPLTLSEHTKCKFIHTGIKGDNILQVIIDPSILESFTKVELNIPHHVNLSTRFGEPVLSDFGSTVPGEVKQDHDAQPNVYRCPEVMLGMEWSYFGDIWNAGCMIWDLFEDKHLLYCNDPHGSGYKTRAHLADVVGMLGPPPLDLLKHGKRNVEFFDEGKWIAGVEVPSIRHKS